MKKPSAGPEQYTIFYGAAESYDHSHGEYYYNRLVLGPLEELCHSHKYRTDRPRKQECLLPIECQWDSYDEEPAE